MNRTHALPGALALVFSLSPGLSPTLPIPAARAADAQPATGAVEEPWLRPDPVALRRWQGMRFGMFLHWGPVSITGHEIGWSRGAQTPAERYDGLYREFNPTRFDARAWVEAARVAGMKYMILTTKHHDGFCLWDTKLTDYNIMRSPFARDVTRELAAACREAGIAFGTYHSVCDWHHPDFPVTSPGGKVRRERSDIAAYRRYLRGQVRELISGYGPLLTMWFDVPQEFDRVEGSENVRLCRELQADILVNNRAGGGAGDYDTPEQRVGGFQMERPWETCMTICRQWAWKPDDKMKSLAECVGVLVRTVGGDGNLLFNVGPMPTGEIEARQVERLKEMGAWLARHGRAVYETRGGPYKPAKHVVSTRRDRTIYLHILGWPEETLHLPPLPATILGAEVLGGGRAAFRQTGAGVEISVPAGERAEIDTVVALEIDRPAMGLEPIPVVSVGQSLTIGARAEASNVFQKNARYGPRMALDDDDHTRWATDAEVGPCWLEVDLGKPLTFDRAVIRECVDFGARVQAFELQAKEGDAWRAFHRGGAIGAELEARFDPVTARVVRLNVTAGKGGPTFHEFHLFAPKNGKATP